MITNRFINEIQKWNKTRDNMRFSPSLEYSMLYEEVDEFLEAGVINDKVAMADALADVIVVAVGGLYKLVEGDTDKFIGIMDAVTAANNTKSSKKNSAGKITKPDNFVGPEAKIKEILNGN
jgi:predicted HAD superfamily Cof-like phosphohydrolase